MKDLTDLRQALDTETALLHAHLTPDVVRQRAHRIRVRRRLGAVAAAVAVVAAAVPAALLLGGGPSSTPYGVGAPPSQECSTSTGGSTLGPLVDTGITLDAPNLHTRFDVLFGLVGTRDQPAFVIAFRDQTTHVARNWHISGLARDPHGDLSGKRSEDPTFRFLSQQLNLGPHSVLDLGIYTRSAQRITVTSEGHESDARTRVNPTSGWTLFWVKRAATPLPEGYNTTPEVYTGPERVTLKAYHGAGAPPFTVTGGFLVGNRVQNPRDNSPVDSPSGPDPSIAVVETNPPYPTPAGQPQPC